VAPFTQSKNLSIKEISLAVSWHPSKSFKTKATDPLTTCNKGNHKQLFFFKHNYKIPEQQGRLSSGIVAWELYGHRSASSFSIPNSCQHNRPWRYAPTGWTVRSDQQIEIKMTSEEEISKDPTHNSLVVFGFMTEDSMLFLKVLMRWGTSLMKKTCRSRAYKFVDL
jgi:hypothetical protein